MIDPAADPVYLSERPGAGRVLVPLSESTAIGVATGLALAGRRVVVELVDLAGLDRARDELADLAGLSARSSGSWVAPVVVRVPLAPGELVPELPPGLRVGVAAGAADDMVQAALAGPDPAVVFVCDGPGAGTMGVPRRLREGAHATLLAHGAGVALSLAAATALEAAGVAVGVVDLCGVEVGGEAVTEAAATGRIVLVGHGLERVLGSTMLAAFWRLESPPRVLRADVGVEVVVRAVNEAMEA